MLQGRGEDPRANCCAFSVTSQQMKVTWQWSAYPLSPLGYALRARSVPRGKQPRPDLERVARSRHSACVERGAASRTTVPRGTCGGRGRRAADAILKSDPRSPSLCVSDPWQLEYREPSLLKGRTLRTRRLAGGTAGGDGAGSECGRRCCHSASPRGGSAPARSPRGGADHRGTRSPRAGGRGAALHRGDPTGLYHAIRRPPRREAERSRVPVSDHRAAAAASGKLGHRAEGR